ncbi:hypothetical protein GEU84_010650 [Fertoebacter nigrum]|uniref:AlgX/AlgJ SGNH hydrolase-like domain-containing protein n=1 Tax=Fertoeibacter niger TaxID=2656921 RepID=A0A8X8GV01_9RHOB|nr:hypothetical protein [Fertoeibacter niger]NUB44844.1 hypothetical protein [Fertoeibacter niger]
MTIRATFALAFGLAALAAAPVAAQSVFGCTDLDGRHSMASIEGANGTFYRVNPDLRMFHGFSDETVDDLARLSQALSDQGTTLVYIPLPTKSLALPDMLPQRARDYGFDVSMATTLYIDIQDRLREKSVLTADVRRALRAGGKDAPSIFQADYRLTSAGAQRMAQAIGETISQAPGFAGLPRGRFETRPSGMVTLPSDMRSALQRHCMIALPPVETENYATDRLQAASASNESTIFGGRAVTARVAIVGTEHTGEAAVNLPGFLAQATGLEVLQYSVNGGGSFAAISSYLTSREFQEARPAFLVWINPVENNLAQFGDQPLRELIAAAGPNCRLPLPTLAGSRADVVTADLTPLDRSQNYTLLVESDGTQATSARFEFRAASGLMRAKSVYRHPDQVKTGRFYMPMSGLWPEGAQAVDIVLDVPFAGSARVTACFD